MLLAVSHFDFSPCRDSPSGIPEERKSHNPQRNFEVIQRIRVPTSERLISFSEWINLPPIHNSHHGKPLPVVTTCVEHAYHPALQTSHDVLILFLCLHRPLCLSLNIFEHTLTPIRPARLFCGHCLCISLLALPDHRPTPVRTETRFEILLARPTKSVDRKRCLADIRPYNTLS